jgi:hypothetical protein
MVSSPTRVQQNDTLLRLNRKICLRAQLFSLHLRNIWLRPHMQLQNGRSEDKQIDKSSCRAHLLVSGESKLLH